MQIIRTRYRRRERRLWHPDMRALAEIAALGVTFAIVAFALYF